tara:strand:+ start:1324 stop:2601 length:1278 start_codon:yes stop_codon:yes gene_type:complete
VSKYLFYILLLLFLSSCSSLKKEAIEEKNEEINLFQEIEPIKKELNPGLIVNISRLKTDKVFLNNNSNNTGNINFETNFDKKYYYKFKKIEKFKNYQPELIFTDKKNIVFFDGKGSIFKIDENFKNIWKINNYNKKEKKLNPILYFAQNGKNLIVNDNISKFYSINLNSGEILWSKYSLSSFNSNIKITKDKFITIDFDNVIRCFLIKNGKEVWNFQSENSFIKSEKKLSLILKDEIVFFINNLGDVTALNSIDGTLLWQTPTQSSIIYQNAFSLENSDLVIDNDTIYFSNNKNEFFSIDSSSGIINWKQTINSSLIPTVVEDLVLTISNEGFLFVIEKNTGNILRITNTLSNIKNKKNQIKPVGFVLAKNKIYLSLNNGRLVKIDFKTGLQENIFKLHGSKISRPYIFHGSMYLIKDNSIIKSN